MMSATILQAQQNNVDTFVIFLAILLLIFPVLFVRHLLKGWRPESTGGLFWKALLVFSAPFYIGIIVIKVFSATGVVSEQFGQLFPSLQRPAPGFPQIPQGSTNFWSEYTVGLMAAALISGIATILIYSIFKDRKSSGKRVGGLVFWGALYASAIIVANGVFDRIQEAALEGQARKTQQQQEALEAQEKAQKEKARTIGERIFLLGSGEDQGKDVSPETYDEKFRREKTEAEIEKGELAKKAPDGVIEKFLRATSLQVQMLAKQDPLACNYFLQTGTYLRRFRDYFQTTNASPEMVELLKALAQEVNSPERNGVSQAMPSQEFKAATQKIYQSIKTKIPRDDQNFDVFDNPQKLVTKKQKTQGCYTYQAYLDEISNLPPDEAIRYYRALLENRASALNAESALAGNRQMLTLYRDLAGRGTALGLLFEDNPDLKKDFVLYLIEHLDEDFSKTEEAAKERKKDLLDANIRYYFALAKDPAVFGHISYHVTFLKQLREVGPAFCGRLAGVLEKADVSLFGNAYYDRHERTLVSVMKSSRTGGRDNPAQLSSSDYKTALSTIRRDMEKAMNGRDADLDMLFNKRERSSQNERAEACGQAIAFYSVLSGLGQRPAAEFLRTMLLEENS